MIKIFHAGNDGDNFYVAAETPEQALDAIQATGLEYSAEEWREISNISEVNPLTTIELSMRDLQEFLNDAKNTNEGVILSCWA